jgi:hypothetical protein
MASAQLTLPLSTRPQKFISNLLFVDMAAVQLPLWPTVDKNQVINSPNLSALFHFFFWHDYSYLIRLQRLFLSITSQQYLAYQCHSYLRKKESLYQFCLDITFLKDKFRPVLQKLELKDPSGFLNSQILSTTEYLSNHSSRYHNNCWMFEIGSLITVTIS